MSSYEITRELDALFKELRTMPDIAMAAKIVDFLNSLIDTDRETLEALIERRESCSDSLRDHPSVQVVVDPGGFNPTVGLLGLLNGLCGTFADGGGPVVAQYDDGYGLIGFKLRSE